MATNTIAQFGFHNYKDALVNSQLTWLQWEDFTYTFENFFHPFVSELIQQVNRASVPGLLDPNYQQSLTTEFFDNFYTELTDFLTHINHFPKEIDLRDGGPYANYDWELLFHIPLTIAVHLSKNQRFAEAQRWFHFIFDPTCTDTSVPTPQRFWKFLAFRKADGAKQIDELLTLLSKPDAECSSTEQDLKRKVLSGYEAIKNKPFQPHAVARTRQIAYQYCVVMKYLDNLIAWGDSLFRQDTIESINEATQIYVLAANLLGERPQRIPSLGKVQPKTFAQLKAKGLDPMGNALVELEGKFPLNLGLPQTQSSDPGVAAPLFGIGRTLYFCIPRNDKLLSYWDTVGDRLFKIRNCLNIEGVFRQLALFDPPIDPGMLVKAAAAGIDIGSVINGLNQPPSPVRTPLIIQKALELCAEVRSLGSALLSAIEKGESEQLALLRQSHEIKIQQMTQDVRFLQWKQAQESTRSLLTSRATALERLHYYQRLLGLPADTNALDTLPLDFEHLSLTEENFDQNYAALVGQYDKTLALQTLPNLTIAGGSSPSNQSGASGQGALYLNSKEDAELNTLLPTARDTGLAASVVEAVGAALAFIPDAKGNLHFWGLGGTIDVKVGTAITKSVEIAARILRMISVYNQEQANIAAKTALHERRADDWLLQYNLAAHELMQIGRQILTSLIAEQIAHHEYLTIQQQIEQSQETERFLNEKFTNQELYAWMQGELSRLYYEYYRFAFDTARKAEQTMKRELMRPEVDATDYIKFNYWDGGRKGLLSGEALYLDVKRMEMAYHENNKRELELTKHISLLQVSPRALLQLRTTGSCTVSLPEELFDMDGPGHYLRRIKTVAVTIPCVTGSYTSVNCTLTLLKSSIRKNALLKDGNYPREDSEDDRFIDSFGNLQSIVTSTGQSDSGLFETNLRDDRYLPFEGLGAISEWKLELPANPSKGDPLQFDYDTITDVILHMRYTARDGGRLLKNAAIANVKEQIDAAQTVGSVRLFSLRHEFPTEWAKFKSAKIEGETKTAELTLNLRAEHYPFWSQGHLEAVKRLDFFAETVKNTVDISTNADGTGSKDSLLKDAGLGNLRTGKLTNIPLPAPISQFTLYFNDNSMEELWLAVRWGKAD
ncbi:Tc toxin subunit A-related protein [Allocoleopsis franciscana]|uniref:Tc toxin complex TcA C-terminal TcB-binding domain-containing protein n=1 Tax=Allocoleopsis franciscana PCC 7113 TaxID=1173027 RepID=K9WQK7_9CYAN|nr:hypothetical protein [Allocoleopsis franciscana]AFZ22071.1 hypothetical protein Mic7113_6491 [Allocoleopsis franciscana PCC 7113]